MAARLTVLHMPLASAAGMVLLALPWLWPFTAGPSTNVIPWMATWGCLALATLLWAFGGPSPVQAAPRAWLLAACVSAVLAMAQWFGLAPDSPLISPSQPGLAYANLRQRNQFATLISIGLAALLWMPAAARSRLMPAALLLLAVANAASASRTGLLQWILLLGLTAAWPGEGRRRFIACGAALVAYAAASALLPQMLFHWRGISAPSVYERAVSDLGCSSRRVLWDNVLHLIAQKPWTGWGVGELDYAHYATLYPGERFCDILDNAHNLPLHLAVELGIPAALVILLMLGAAIWFGRPFGEKHHAKQFAWAALAVIGAHSMLEYPLWYGPFQLALVLCVLVLVGARRCVFEPHARWLAGISAALLLVALAWLWIRYDLVSEAYRPPESRRESMRMDPIAAVRNAFPFDEQLRFADLSLREVTSGNAAEVHALASELVHYSPEPMVIEKLIDSAWLLGRDQEAALHSLRFKAAFPERYKAWFDTGRPAQLR